MTSDVVLTTVQILIAVVGVGLFLRQIREERGVPYFLQRFPLAEWNVNGWTFGMAVIRVILTLVFCQWVVVYALKGAGEDGQASTSWELLAMAAATQGGLLMGLLVAMLLLREPPRGSWETPEALGHPPPLAWRLVPGAGVITFVITFGLVLATTYLWREGLEWFEVPLPEQEMLSFVKDSASTAELLTAGFLACVVAPIAEEGLFRAGLFRFLRTRLPRWAALVVPSVIFAVVHFNLAALPGLLILATVFGLAYERTGRIAVPMIAHALFNLNTLIGAIFSSPQP